MLSKRLELIINLMKPSNVLADIGTDHGYIPTQAIRMGIIKKAIAADISKGSLDKAIIEIKKCKLEDRIETRLGSGLDVLGVDEADVVVIAGMGGILISDILEDSYHKKFKLKHPYLIFQPVQLPEKLRRYLYLNNFEIIDEELIEEDGKIYHIIVSRYSKNEISKVIKFPIDEIGEINILKENDILLELLAYKIASNKDILRKIKLNDNDNEKIKKRTEEVSLKIKCCEEMIANVTKRDKDQIR